MDMLAIYFCSVREMPPAVKNHLVNIYLIPSQGPLPSVNILQPAAVLFCVSRSLHKLDPWLGMHFLAWKIPVQHSLQPLKNLLWSVLPPQLELSFPSLGPSVFCTNSYYPLSHMVFTVIYSLFFSQLDLWIHWGQGLCLICGFILKV